MCPCCLLSSAWSCELEMEPSPAVAPRQRLALPTGGVESPHSWGCCPARAGGWGSVAPSCLPAVLPTGIAARPCRDSSETGNC